MCLLHMYQLRPEFSTPNMTSCVPRLVRNCISCIERYGCTKCPTIGRFLHSSVILYTQLYAHIQDCWMISTALLLYRVTLQCLSPFKEIFSGKTTGTLCSSYRPFQGIVMIWWQHCLSVCLFVCLSVCLSPQRVLVQSVSQYQPPDRRTVLILLQSVSKSRSAKHLTPELRSYNSYPFCRIACVIFH